MNSVHLEPEHQILFRIIWDNKTVIVTNGREWSVDNCDSWAHEAVWGTRARNNTNDDVWCRDTDMDMVDSDGKCCQLSVQAMCPALNELKHTTWKNPNKLEYVIHSLIIVRPTCIGVGAVEPGGVYCCLLLGGRPVHLVAGRGHPLAPLTVTAQLDHKPTLCKY